jgi:hypothetical protein
MPPILLSTGEKEEEREGEVEVSESFNSKTK